MDVDHRLLNEKVKKRTKYLKNKLTEFDEFEALEKELGIKTKSLTSSPKKEKVDKDITTVFSDEEEETESLDDAPFIVEKIESNTGKEEIIEKNRLLWIEDDRIHFKFEEITLEEMKWQ